MLDAEETRLFEKEDEKEFFRLQIGAQHDYYKEFIYSFVTDLAKH